MNKSQQILKQFKISESYVKDRDFDNVKKGDSLGFLVDGDVVEGKVIEAYGKSNNEYGFDVKITTGKLRGEKMFINSNRDTVSIVNKYPKGISESSEYWDDEKVKSPVYISSSVMSGEDEPRVDMKQGFATFTQEFPVANRDWVIGLYKKGGNEFYPAVKEDYFIKIDKTKEAFKVLSKFKNLSWDDAKELYKELLLDYS